MSDGTAIEWATATWNPVVGCTRVSSGCDHCYAVRQSYRLERMHQAKYAGLTVLNGKGDRHFNGKVRCDAKALPIPLKWRDPRRVFVNSMSDLFHREVPFKFIAAVHAIAAACPQHTMIVLTKRPDRAMEFYKWISETIRVGKDAESAVAAPLIACGAFALAEFDKVQGPKAASIGDRITIDLLCNDAKDGSNWPPRNLWLLASCEDQATLDERVPHLLKCPAAVRGLSLEPLLGEIDLSGYLGGPYVGMPGDRVHENYNAGIDWVITGVESRGHHAGRGAAEYPERALSIIRQCHAAGVAVFNKQMPGDDGTVSGLPSQWAEPWRVREFPEGKSTTQTPSGLSSGTRAFTLIELLVVIGVLAVLLGIVLPSLFGARSAGGVTKCTSNLAQIGKTMRLYMDEQRRFPDRLVGSDAPMELPPGVLACPLNRTQPEGWAPAQFGPLAGWSWAALTSYESLPMTVPNLAWNPVVYINRWEQSRPDQQVPLCNDTRQAAGVFGWHATSGGAGGGKVNRYNAAWAAGDVTWWDGVVP